MPPKFGISLVVLAACLLLVTVTSAKSGWPRGNPLGPIVKCEAGQRNFLRWVCGDLRFHFPFETRGYAFLQVLPLPDRRRFPFQYQSAKCCARGCKLKEYLKMCGYHSAIKQHCKKRSNARKNICSRHALARIRPDPE